MPEESPLHSHAWQLNPDAGTHEITADPEELAIATAAASETWDLFPYYEERYGERGRRFCVSDTAWLVVLPRYGRSAAVEHVHWLGQLLSARGMPQLLLETHLGNLHEALLEVRDGAARYGVLRACGESLRRQRERQLPAATFRELAEEFDSLTAGVERRLPRVGELLVSAAADEGNGISSAVSAISGWCSDPARFPTDWIEAVDLTITRARRMTRAKGGGPDARAGQ